MSYMQHSRRVDPYPSTWEIPLAAIVALVLVLVLGVHLGRGMANLFAGAGWTWPARENLFNSLTHVLAGQPGAGLTHRHQTAGLASPRSVQAWIGLTELILLAGSTWAALVGLHRWGPRRIRGMAACAEAEQLLGLRRLRRVRAMIRPDLYPPGSPRR